MASQELMISERRELLPAPSDWQLMSNMAEVFAKSGGVIANVYAALSIMQKGRELGIPPMQALSSIYIVQGKVSCSAELMRALIQRDHGDDALDIVEMSAAQCVIRYKRKSWKDYREVTYTQADAERALLWNKGENWKKTPDLMMLARCTTKLARASFADVIAGMYERDEAEGIELPQESRDTRVVEHPPIEPLQLPNRTVDKATGEITTPPKPADVTREELQALAATLHELAPDEDVSIPDKMTRGTARELKQLWTDSIAVARTRLQSDADTSFDMPEGGAI